jgi:23S rRNA pseudouridine1911/1915/1917 synthase
MASDRTYHIRPVLDGQTLAAGLRGLNAKLSWADARRLIHNRHVQVNGNLVLDEARRLKTGDVVKVFEQPRAPVPTDRDVRVVHIDEDLIIIDKPAGITTLRHGQEQEWDDRRKQRQPTLDEVVEGMLPKLAQQIRRTDRRGDPPAQAAKHATPNDPASGILRRSGRRVPEPQTKVSLRDLNVRPVHRLDRDTSGLMLFALSARAEPALIALFKSHTIRRSYLAVVHGTVTKPVRIESWFVRDRGDGLRGSTASGREEPGSQHAVTHIEPIEPIGDAYTLVHCRLETGRTHQIRIHLAEAGHMLCGEKTYTRPQAGASAVHEQSGAPRQALHSAELEFKHPFLGQTQKFNAPLPKDLSQWLAGLKANHGS